MTGAGVLLSDDLIFSSRVLGTARDHGLVVSAARTQEGLLDRVRRDTITCVILDLAFPGLVISSLLSKLSEAALTRPRVVAYGPHVDAAGLKAARDGGCHVVLPRSAFVDRLPTDLAAWLLPLAGAGAEETPV